eukprot:TRINITY_DN3515_c1_g1_i3.p1 TRINITY_DN3515_c1_g1~~TRINITY_DN3515_c1_g1_i3.p1  ORF type:complete len:175 (+),score=9.78 TRINITY_DN3515_c1_g1_i3:334-858(+)
MSHDKLHMVIKLFQLQVGSPLYIHITYTSFLRCPFHNDHTKMAHHSVKCCRRRGRKRYHAQQTNLPRLEFGVYAIATILWFPSSSSDHPILYKLCIYSLLLFFYASFAIPVISDRYVGLAHFSARAATLSAAVAVASLLCIAMEAEFRWLTYLFRIFFLLFVYSLSGCCFCVSD